MSSKFEYVNCNLCGSNKTRVLIKDLANIMQCKKCGLVYRNPRFLKGKLPEQYNKKAVWYDSKINLFKKNLRRIEKYSSKGRLLDVGCGYGTFLKMAENNGWQVWGVDISKLAYDYAKEKLGLNIFKGTLKEAHFPDNNFDVVTLWGVLAELYNPLAELQEIKRILKRNGLIVLRLHNVALHIFVHRLFRKLGNLDVKVGLKLTVFHLYNFSPKTIEKILMKTGFEDIKVIPSEFTSGDPYSAGKILTLFGMRLIKKISFSLCQFIFYLTGGSLILAPSILVFARKSSQ